MHRRRFRLGWAAAAGALAALVVLVPVEAQSASTTAAQNGWGYGFKVQLWHYDPVARSNVIGDVNQAGFNWMTQQIEWQAVELSPGEYDWSQLDHIVNDGNAAGLNIMLSFEHAPVVLSDPRQRPDARPTGDVWRSSWARWPRATRARCRRTSCGMRRTSTAKQAPAMSIRRPTCRCCEAGYTGVKASDPNAKVLLGAPRPTDVQHPGLGHRRPDVSDELYAINNGEVNRLLRRPFGPPERVLEPARLHAGYPVLQPVGRAGTPTTASSPSPASASTTTSWSQNGDDAKQIWFTEFGYCSNPTPPPGYEYCRTSPRSSRPSSWSRPTDRAQDAVGRRACSSGT